MTPKQRENLKRLLKPRHIAIIGGRDAEVVFKECERIGFAGKVWPVNPKRETLCGVKCYASVDDLPEPPDATFLAVPAKVALKIVARLVELRAGGIVCYTAGFGGVGQEGGEADQALVEAAGDLAVVGPNCYGVINYVERVALWPFEQGGWHPGYGAAVITQSGMMSSDITMSQRSLPLSFMLSAGNQSVLQLEDYVDVLCERDEVRAFGLYIEGLKDVAAFCRVAHKALECNKPIVVLKTGTSKTGALLTVSHTGSLSGRNEYYQALFNKLGIISVDTPAELIETLKFICISGVLKGNKLMGFTCSGGGATMLADYAEKKNLDVPQPSVEITKKLGGLLPEIAAVSNPLDYTTPIWGFTEKTQPVFEAALEDGYDAAMIVQDYPLPEIDESKQYYLNDAIGFINSTAKMEVPGAVCSTLSENIDRETREFLIAHNVTPLQGLREGLNAIDGACWYGQRRQSILDEDAFTPVQIDSDKESVQIDEAAGKALLKAAGFDVPEGRVSTAQAAVKNAKELGFPVALKLNSALLAHKTEAGAVRLGIENEEELIDSIRQMQIDVRQFNPAIDTDCFLVEKMQERPIAELMVSVRQDDQFGLVMTLASGGVFVELVADAVTLLLPASEMEIPDAMSQLKIISLLKGYRGSNKVDSEMLRSEIIRLADFIIDNKASFSEIEINPLFVNQNNICIVDVLLRQS